MHRLKTLVKNTKKSFFNFKIIEIVNKKWGPWELMSWVNKQKLLATETIKFNSQLCLELDNLWQALHSTFNTTQYYSMESNILDKLESFASSLWALFLEKEFTDLLQTQVLRVGQVNESCIGLTQENSIENSV